MVLYLLLKLLHNFTLSIDTTLHTKGSLTVATMISEMSCRPSAPLNSFLSELLSSKECEHITIASDTAKCMPPQSMLLNDCTISFSASSPPSSREISFRAEGTAAIIDEVQLVLNDTRMPMMMNTPRVISPTSQNDRNSKKKMRWESSSDSFSNKFNSPTRKLSDDSLSCPTRKESDDQLSTLQSSHKRRGGRRRRPEKNASFDDIQMNKIVSMSKPQTISASSLARAILFD